MRARSPLLVFLLAACGPRDRFGLELERSEVVPTVFTARWSYEGQPDAAWFELAREGVVERSVPVDPAGGPVRETFLLGFAPASTYTVQLVVEEGGVRLESDRIEVTTGMVPPDLPELSVERAEGAEPWQGLLVTSVLTLPPAAVILDEDGEYLWWFLPGTMDSVGRARLSLDGRSVLFQGINLWNEEENALHRVRLDGTGLEALDTPQSHHDFVELPDGTIAYLAYAPRTIDGVEVPGDQVVELSPDGSTRVVYDAWEDPALVYDPADAYMGRMWPHANALDWIEEEDAYLVSFLALDCITRIDRATGAVDWRLGGDASDFSLLDGSTDLFDHQHQHEWLDGSLLVFENGPIQMGRSRAVEYALNLDGGGVFEAWSHESTEGLSSMVLGDVHRFDTGTTLITWSYDGVIQEVDEAGTPIWTLGASVGGAFGYTTWWGALPAQ